MQKNPSPPKPPQKKNKKPSKKVMLPPHPPPPPPSRPRLFQLVKKGDAPLDKEVWQAAGLEKPDWREKETPRLFFSFPGFVGIIGFATLQEDHGEGLQ